VADADRELQHEIDRLYGVAPEDFVEEREALARRLRSERRRDEARDVHALRKPSQAAWAINRVARDDPRLADDVVSADEALRRAQSQLASGGGPDALRTAANAQREAVDRFTAAARDVLARAGTAGEDALRRIRETLLAAATDPALGELVRAGRVVREQAPIGFGPFAAVPEPIERPPAPARRRRDRPAARPKDGREGAAEAARDEAGRAARDEARRRADAQARAEEDARRRAEAQARASEARASEARAHGEAERLEAALDEAGGRVAEARADLDRARRALGEAVREAANLERAVKRARAEAARASARRRELEAEAPS
jgi:hypothetical protein